MNNNSIIKEKIIIKLQENPKGIAVLDIPDISYEDLSNVWNYFRNTDEKYIEKYGKYILDWDVNKKIYYKRMFNKHEIFHKLFSEHVESTTDNLVLFYNKTEDSFFCKYKTVNTINESIIDKYKESIDKYKDNLSNFNTESELDPNISLFWSIQLVVSNLQEDFNVIYEKGEIDEESTLVVIF